MSSENGQIMYLLPLFIFSVSMLQNAKTAVYLRL